MLFYCGYGYAVSKMEFHITHSNFLGYSLYDTIFLFHVKQIEEKIYQHLYVFRCESKNIPNNRNERTAYWNEISQEYLF